MTTPASPAVLPSPPGFLSPAAFPFPNGPFPFPNDAPPPPPQPYYAGQGNSSAGSSATVAVTIQNPTRAGDAIAVSAESSAGGGAALTCTDTQGNIYSQVIGETSLSPVISMWVAQNTHALGTSDTITVTFTGASTQSQAIAAGIPAGAVVPSPGGAWLTYGTSAVATTGSSTSLPVTAPNPFPGPVMILASAATTTVGVTVQFPQGWTVLATGASKAIGGFAVASKLVTGYTASGTTILNAVHASGNLTLQYVTFQLETRIASNRPVPDMPPGMQSPGAWQRAPLGNPHEGPATVRYNPGPNKWTENLPAVSVSHPAMTRSTGKQAPATPHPAGALAKGARKSLAAAPHATGKLVKSAARILAATAHPAGAMARAAGKHLAAAPHAAGALVRSAGKHLAAAGHPLGAMLAARARTLAATVHPAGKLARSTGKRLAATPHPVAAILRNRAMVLAARITAAGRLLLSKPAPSFRLGIPGTEWSVSISTIGISQLATQYVFIPVAATRSGIPYNPTADVVQFAFMATATKVPQSSDWVSGSWDLNPASLIYPYNAKCLVGPSGVINPGLGAYIMYIRISDNPEVPVLIAGQLQIQ